MSAAKPASRPCAACGGRQVRLAGVIEDPAVFCPATGAVGRRARPAVYWACDSCEACEEVGR